MPGPIILPMALICVNIASFAMMGIDKRRAVTRRRRIPERALFFVSACFGALGTLIAMNHFHHKTRYLRFKAGVPLMLFVQVALLVLLFARNLS